MSNVSILRSHTTKLYVASCLHLSRGFSRWHAALLECPESHNTAASESLRYSTATSLPNVPGSVRGIEDVQTCCTIIMRPHAFSIEQYFVCSSEMETLRAWTFNAKASTCSD